MKRAFDIVASALGLIFLFPLLGIAALLVKLTSRGPVFFRQERVGRGFRPFRIRKFRTMVADAPSRGGAITVGGDPRVTGVGRVLRACKIDELPQLFNVLTGDMSLVGPRPEVPRYVELFRADYEEVLKVRPGITDLASIEFRDESELLARAANPEEHYRGVILPRKIALAKEYVSRSTFLFDLGVIFRTLFRIARPSS